MSDGRWFHGGALLLALAAAALIPWVSPGGESLPELLGAGPLGAGLLWACGVCFGGALLVLGSGGSGLVAYLAAASNLAKISSCVGVCWAALAS